MTFKVYYDSVGGSEDLLIRELHDRLGAVLVVEPSVEAEGHLGPMLSGKVTIAGETSLAMAQESLDDLSADYMGNGMFLWAEARER